MSEGVVVRPMGEADLRRYVPVRLEALRDHPAAFGTAYEDQCGDSDEAWLKRLGPALRGEASRLFLAEAGENVVGLTGVFRETGSKTRHAATLYSVYVRPAWRGKGIADRLVAAAAEWCRAEGVTILRLTVTTTNEPAVRCYKRLGFEVTGTMPWYIRTADGAYHDEYLMSLKV